MSRLWGIPLIGVWIRAILCIPHVIILAFYAIVVGALQLIMWIPVLLLGRYPDWGYDLVGGFIRWSIRVQAYVSLLAAAYPPFSSGGSHSVNVTWDRSQSVPRWAGIPFIGAFIRVIILIPHFVLVWLIGIVAGFLSLFTWIPVLLFGRYPGWGYTIIGGLVAYEVRLQSYLLLMTGPYPRFGLED